MTQTSFDDNKININPKTSVDNKKKVDDSYNKFLFKEEEINLTNELKNLENKNKFCFEDISKNFILENSEKILEMIPEDKLFSDERITELKNNYNNILKENNKLNKSENELKKTFDILIDYIKIQEVKIFS